MHKYCIRASAVILSLALSGAVLASNHVISHSADFNGFAVGLSTNGSLENLGQYDVIGSYKHGSYMFDISLSATNTKANASTINYETAAWMLRPLATKWNLMFGANVAGTYYTDKTKAGVTNNPWQAAGTLGLNYAYNDHIMVLLDAAIIAYTFSPSGAKSWEFISTPRLGLRYFFN